MRRATRARRPIDERFQRLLAEGVIVLVGPTLGSTNTGIAILEAPDEAPRDG